MIKKRAIFIILISLIFVLGISSCDSEKCTAKDTGLSMTYDAAKTIALRDCKEALKESHICNENTGTYWIDLELEKSGCNPACVVNIESKKAEINWRCTGLISDNSKKIENFKENLSFSFYKEKSDSSDVDFYIINYTGNKIFLRSNPEELNIQYSVDESLFKGINKLWISTYPNLLSDSIISEYEIGRFTSIIGVNTSYALTKDAPYYNEYNCKNATSLIRVIEVRLESPTRVYSEGNCIIVAGATYSDMIMAADKLVVKWFGTIQ